MVDINHGNFSCVISLSDYSCDLEVISEWAPSGDLLLIGPAQDCRRGFAKAFIKPVPLLLAFSCSVLLVLHLVCHQTGNYSEIDLSSTHKVLIQYCFTRWSVGEHRELEGMLFHRDSWHCVELNPRKSFLKRIPDWSCETHYVSSTSLKKWLVCPCCVVTFIFRK